jgi:L-arabonate dehydrase
VMREVLPLLHGDLVTVTGKSVRDNVSASECYNRDVIHTLADPLHPEGGTVILRGNLAPDGAVLKQTAASAHLLKHRGKAYVFENHQQMIEEINRPDLPVTQDSVLVMKNGGPRGAPGFPEWGQIPMPVALLNRGVDDVVRISDARMSGTSFGTVVLHVAPESAIGGPLGLVRTGDEIELNVELRSLTLCVDPEELKRRAAEFVVPTPKYDRGYGKLFLEHVTQANLGCDFDFLRAVPKKAE